MFAAAAAAAAAADPFASEAVTAFMGSVAVPCADSANSGAAAAAAAPVTGTSDSWQ